MKTIAEIAKEIGVSKQAVYDKIKKEPLSSALKDLIEKVDNTLHIKLDGVELIKSAFNKESQSIVSSKPLDTISQVLIETLQKQIETITKELAVKNKQIEDLQNALEREREHSRQQAENLTELTRNSQILLKQEQEKTAFLLPDQPPTVPSEPDASGMKLKQRPFWQFWKK